MTKSSEVALLQSWIAAAPADSYLLSMLRHIAPQFERDTRSDFHTLPDLAALERERTVAEARLSAVKQEVRTAETHLDAIRLRVQVGFAELEKIRDCARRIVAMQ